MRSRIIRSLVYECQGRADMALAADLREAFTRLLEFYDDPAEAQRARDAMVNAVQQIKTQANAIDDAVAKMDRGDAKAAAWLGNLLSKAFALSGLDNEHQNWAQTVGDRMADHLQQGGRVGAAAQQQRQQQQDAPQFGEPTSVSMADVKAAQQPRQQQAQSQQKQQPDLGVTGLTIGSSVDDYGPSELQGKDFAGWQSDLFRAGGSAPSGAPDLKNIQQPMVTIAGHTVATDKAPANTYVTVSLGNLQGLPQRANVNRQGRIPTITFAANLAGNLNTIKQTAQRDPTEFAQMLWSKVQNAVAEHDKNGLYQMVVDAFAQGQTFQLVDRTKQAESVKGRHRIYVDRALIQRSLDHFNAS